MDSSPSENAVSHPKQNSLSFKISVFDCVKTYSTSWSSLSAHTLPHSAALCVANSDWVPYGEGTWHPPKRCSQARSLLVRTPLLKAHGVQRAALPAFALGWKTEHVGFNTHKGSLHWVKPQRLVEKMIYAPIASGDMFHLPCHFLGGLLDFDFLPALSFSLLLNFWTPFQAPGLSSQGLSTGGQYCSQGESPREPSIEISPV